MNLLVDIQVAIPVDIPVAIPVANGIATLHFGSIKVLSSGKSLTFFGYGNMPLSDTEMIKLVRYLLKFETCNAVHFQKCYHNDIERLLNPCHYPEIMTGILLEELQKHNLCYDILSKNLAFPRDILKNIMSYVCILSPFSNIEKALFVECHLTPIITDYIHASMPFCKDLNICLPFSQNVYHSRYFITSINMSIINRLSIDGFSLERIDILRCFSRLEYLRITSTPLSLEMKKSLESLIPVVIY